MVTQIQLGNFFSVNGRTVLGGLSGSGLNTQALLDGLVAAKRLPATRLESRIKNNDAKLEAILQFRQLMANFKDAANFLRNPPGVDNAASNVFKYNTTSVTASTGGSGTSYLKIETAPGAEVQIFTVNSIESVAKAKKQSSSTFAISSPTASVVETAPGMGSGLFKAGTFTLNDVEITFNAGDSLSSVAAKFNAVKSQTGISASIIKVGENSYQLSFSATATGTENDFDFNNVDVADTLIDASGVFDEITIGTTQPVSDAVFFLNGVEITRSTNVINDVIDGVTFTILQATPDDPPTSLEVEITRDTELAKNGILNFINAYNELKIFAAEQQELNEDGTFADTAILANNNTLKNLTSTLNSQLASIVGGLTSGDPSRLSDLGITFGDLPESANNPFVRNVLAVDDATLDTVLENNFEAVRRVFEYDFVTNNPNLLSFARTNDATLSNFTLAANPYAIQTTQGLSVVDLNTPVVSATPVAGQFKAGIFTINGVDIELEAGDSINDIVQKVNDESANTNLAASAVEDPAGVFKIVFTSTTTDSSIGFNLKSTNQDPNGIFDEVTMDATASFIATYDGGDPIVFTATKTSGGTSYTLTAPDDSPLKGMKLIYGGGLTTNIEVSITRGIADVAYNTSNRSLSSDKGAFVVEIDTFTAANNKLTQEIARIDEQVNKYREQLLAKFSALEQALSRVNLLLQNLDAQNQARKNVSS